MWTQELIEKLIEWSEKKDHIVTWNDKQITLSFNEDDDRWVFYVVGDDSCFAYYLEEYSSPEEIEVFQTKKVDWKL